MVSELVMKRHPERQLLAALEDSVGKLLAWVPPDLEDLEPWCPVAALALRLIRAVARDGRGGASAAPAGSDAALHGAEGELPDRVSVIYELLTRPDLLTTSFCSGWPVFRLLSLAVVNYSSSSGSVQDLQRRFFERLRDEPLQSGAITTAFARCAGSASWAACLGAARASFEEVHAIQRGLLLGHGSCPPGSFATWLDRMPPAPTFALCVRTGDNLIDGTIQRRGEWGTCRELANLAQQFGSPGCQILDVGANIGACTVMLALLGYKLTAFEPLPDNLELLLASLRLNSIRPILPDEDQASQGGASAVIHPFALGDQDGMGTLFEGRQNAGMSVVVPEWPSPVCDDSSFFCHQPRKMRVARLDDFWGSGDGPICLAKIDVEGNELRVLRGAVALLRAKMIRVLHIEWWPPHLLALGDEPAAVPWFLHALGYELFAPANWFSRDMEDTSWARVVPDQFAFLGGRWGDLIARPAEAL